MPSLRVDASRLRKQICDESFYAFVQEFWAEVVSEKPVWNWHIKYLCDEFQADAERVLGGKPKLYDTIVNISPGSTKSTILSIMAPAWLLAKNPAIRTICASHTGSLTFELGRKCRLVLDSDKFRATFPDVVPASDQWTKSKMATTAGGGRLACTVGGMSPTGFHAHFILVDDPLDPEKARRMSGKELATANAFMSETIPSRKVDKEITPTWLIMQRLHQSDCTGYLLERKPDEIRHICLPAEKSPRIKPLEVRRHYRDGLMDPVRLSRQVCAEQRQDLGAYGYAGQYDQHPVPRGGGMFKTDRIEITQAPRLRSKNWVCLVRGWDKAGTKAGGAYTAGVLMGRWRPAKGNSDGSDDVWWILHVARGQWDSGERETNIVQVAKADSKKVIVAIEQEPGSGGKESAQNSAKRLAGHRVRIIPATGSKEDRADSWSSLVNVHAFKMAPGEWNTDFLEELKYFPHGTYKDQVDAGSVAYAVAAKPSRRVGAR